jgi:hypothetical protein
MKIVTYCSVWVLVATLASPLTAEAFSRRPQSSEISQSQQAGSGPTQRNGGNAQSINAVPEPSSFLLLAIAAVGVGVVFLMRKRFHK